MTPRCVLIVYPSSAFSTTLSGKAPPQQRLLFGSLLKTQMSLHDARMCSHCFCIRCPPCYFLWESTPLNRDFYLYFYMTHPRSLFSLQVPSLLLSLGKCLPYYSLWESTPPQQRRLFGSLHDAAMCSLCVCVSLISYNSHHTFLPSGSLSTTLWESTPSTKTSIWVST